MLRYKSVLLEFFVASPLLRITDFLMDNYLYDYSKKQVAEGAGISRPVLFKHWKTLEKYKIVLPTRKFGKTTLYRLNNKNELIKSIKGFELALIKESSKKIEEETMQKAVA